MPSVVLLSLVLLIQICSKENIFFSENCNEANLQAAPVFP
jgi:hypothetical protein